MTDRPKRKAIPMRVKLAACLRLLGFEPGARIEWDHTPALGLRPVNADGTDYDPPQLDPKHIEPKLHEPHKLKTNGRRGESDLSIDSNSDKARIAKAKRLETAREASKAFYRTMVEANEQSSVVKLEKSRWPQGRKIPSRPFQKRSKP